MKSRDIANGETGELNDPKSVGMLERGIGFQRDIGKSLELLQRAQLSLYQLGRVSDRAKELLLDAEIGKSILPGLVPLFVQIIVELVMGYDNLNSKGERVKIRLGKILQLLEKHWSPPLLIFHFIVIKEDHYNTHLAVLQIEHVEVVLLTLHATDNIVSPHPTKS